MKDWEKRGFFLTSAFLCEREERENKKQSEKIEPQNNPCIFHLNVAFLICLIIQDKTSLLISGDII